MLQTLKAVPTTESAQWYEALPYVVGLLFVVVELATRIIRHRRPYFSAPALASMLSEGITVCIMPVYGLAPVGRFSKTERL